MSDDLNSNSDYAESAARALDAYQDRIGPINGHDHRTDPDAAQHLLAALISDLIHYADQRGLNFEEAAIGAQLVFINEKTDASAYRIGSLVQLTQQATESLDVAPPPGSRGVVTNLEFPPGEPPGYAVRTPGSTSEYWFTAEELQPAPGFRPVPTHAGIVDAPMQAENALIATLSRIALADTRGVAPDRADVEDNLTLLAALSQWAAIPPEQLASGILDRAQQRLLGLRDHLADPNPFELAGEDFPYGPSSGITGPATPPEPPGPGHPGRRPGRRPH